MTNMSDAFSRKGSLSHRSGLAASCLLTLAFFVPGCVSQPPPAGVRYPITSGAHTILPTTEQRILLWADPPLADVALDWLKSHQYADVLLPEQNPLQRMQVSHRFQGDERRLGVVSRT
jgi:hypothetical protein